MKKSGDSIPCQHRKLAHTEAGSVVICEDCGSLVVSFSCLSVRMTLPAFRGLVATLRAADANLDQLLAQAPTSAGLEETPPVASLRRH